MLALALFAGQYAGAQEERGNGFNPGKMDERMAEMMVKELMLSDSQKDRFILDYTAYRKDLREADPRVKEMMSMDPADARKARREQADLSDEEIMAKIQAGFATERAKVEVKEKYFAVFKEYLNAKQLEKVFSNRGFSQGGHPGMGNPGMGGHGMGGNVGFGGPGNFSR